MEEKLVRKLELLSKMTMGVATEEEKAEYWDFPGLCEAGKYQEIFGENNCQKWVTSYPCIDETKVSLCEEHADHLYEKTINLI